MRLGRSFGVFQDPGRVWGLGFRVQGLGFRVQGSGFKVQGSGFGVPGLGFRAWGLDPFACVFWVKAPLSSRQPPRRVPSL